MSSRAAVRTPASSSTTLLPVMPLDVPSAFGFTMTGKRKEPSVAPLHVERETDFEPLWLGAFRLRRLDEVRKAGAGGRGSQRRQYRRVVAETVSRAGDEKCAGGIEGRQRGRGQEPHLAARRDAE